MPPRIKCTYDGCNRWFGTEVEMKTHKETYNGHFAYCQICDVDCKDDYELLHHQITSDQHIACPICGQEFSSEGGREAHVQRAHPAKQNVKCMGCKKNFDKGSAVLYHIETGRCPVIKAADFIQQKAEQQILEDVRAVAADPTMGTSILSIMPYQSPVQNENNLLDNEGAYQRTNWDGVQEHEGLDGQSMALSGLSALTMASFPTLDLQTRAQAVRNGNNNDTDSSSSPLGVSLRDLPGFNTYGPWPTLADANNHILSSNHRQPSTSAAAASTNTNTHILTTSAGTKPRSALPFEHIYNPISRLYVCPSAFCMRSFQKPEQYEKHLFGPPHTKDKVTCDGCFKKFRTSAGLASHIEMSLKCRVRESFDADRVVQKVSAGLIGIEGVTEEGGVRFVEREGFW